MYQALERVDPDTVSVNRALAAARAVGARLRDGQAYLWLAPFVELSRAKRKKPEPLPFDFTTSSEPSSQGASDGSSGDSSPSLYIPLPEVLPEPLPEVLPGPLPDDETASSDGSSSRARVAKVSLVEIKAGGLRARARDLTIAALEVALEERCVGDDFEHEAWVSANLEAALRLEHKYGRDRVLLRWRELLVDVAIGRFKAINGVSLGLLYTVFDTREAFAAQRAERAQNHTRRPRRPSAAGDRFIDQLRRESEGPT